MSLRHRAGRVMRRRSLLVAFSTVLAVAACGSQAADSAQNRTVHTTRSADATATTTASAAAAAPTTATTATATLTAAAGAGDWLQFGYSTGASNDDPNPTGITAANVRTLTRRTVALPGTVDSSPIELHDITISGRVHDVIVLTTSYGRTLALDARSGARLWEFTPSDISSYAGSAQITSASPTADPDRRYVYVSTPDGELHKLVVTTGHQVTSGHWPARMTLLPSHEKLASPPSIDGDNIIVVTDGYNGDIPPYQGHVVELSRSTGQVKAVFNSLCSNVRRLMNPHNCGVTDSAIWGRSGAVIEPDGNILVATSNGATTETVTFNGQTNWSDSVLELSPDGLRLLHNWTPADQLHLTQDDLDLGSTSPALLPGDLAVQGGKAGVLSLLDLKKLDGTTHGAGPRTGGELQRISAPGSTDVFSEPAVATIAGHTYVFVTTSGGTGAYRLEKRRLRVAWQDSTPGTSPVVAGGLLYVYNELAGAMIVRSPTTGRQLTSLPAGQGHWNTPIVVGGRIILPEGNDNEHATTGLLDIYHLPGR